MPGEAVALTRNWRVGRRSVTMTALQIRSGQVATATIEWHPDGYARYDTVGNRFPLPSRDETHLTLAALPLGWP